MAIGSYILAAIGAYLLGSIPTGFLLGKAKGIDIRAAGSGNIGASNVFRSLGKPAGILVLAGDVLKGFLACWLVAGWVHDLALARMPAEPAHFLETLTLTAGLAAILGHNYTCWLRFKGGKGIATSAGVFIALFPAAFLVCFLVWLTVFALGRYASLASIVAAFCLPFAVAFFGGSIRLLVFAAAIAALAICKHKGNIQRLLAGTESRFGQRKSTEADQ